MPRVKDSLWEYATAEGNKIRCAFCREVFAGCTITRMKYHWAKVPSKDIRGCVSVPDEIREMALKAVNELENKTNKRKIADFLRPNTSSTGSVTSLLNDCQEDQTEGRPPLSQPKIYSKLKAKDKEVAHMAIVRCIVANNLPFHLLRTQEFKDACAAIANCGPGYDPPSSENARTSLLDKLKKEADESVEVLKKSWQMYGCTLMSDSWTDVRKRPHINLLACSLKGIVFLKSECTVGKKIFIMNFISSTIDEIDPSNVVLFISDNASNYLSAGHLIEAKYPHIFKVNCAAHCINLMLKEIDTLDFVKPILDDARKIVKFMYKYQHVLDLMRKFTSDRELKRPCATRFASNFLCLHSILKVEDALNYMVASGEWRDSLPCKSEEGVQVKNAIQGNAFWECGKVLIRAIEPLFKVLRMVDGDGPTMGYIYYAMCKAKEAIRDALKGDVQKYSHFWKIIDDRWRKSMHSPLHAIAAYLNPHLFYGGHVRIEAEIKNGLQYVLSRMLPNENERLCITEELREYHSLGDKIFGSLAISSLTVSHPCIWWDQWGSEVPILQKLAIKILGQPCSASACERNWSAFEAAHTKKRNRLEPKWLSDLVYVRMNNHMKKENSKRARQIKEPIDIEKIIAFPDLIEEDEPIEDVDSEDEGGEDEEENEVELDADLFALPDFVC